GPNPLVLPSHRRSTTHRRAYPLRVRSWVSRPYVSSGCVNGGTYLRRSTLDAPAPARRRGRVTRPNQDIGVPAPTDAVVQHARRRLRRWAETRHPIGRDSPVLRPNWPDLR